MLEKFQIIVLLNSQIIKDRRMILNRKWGTYNIQLIEIQPEAAGAYCIFDQEAASHCDCWRACCLSDAKSLFQNILIARGINIVVLSKSNKE